MRSPLRKLTLLLTLLVTTSSCGGGALLAEGGIGGSGISWGVITGFGSIYVNGVRYDTDTAQISHNGQVITQSDLRVGMIVSVQGSIDADGVNGTADTVTYSERLHGPVQTNDGMTTLTIMGQTVLVDANTLFDGVADITALNMGDVVEVSGFSTPDNSIYATYIELEPSTTHEIIGVVTAVTSNSFNIGNLVVNFADTTGIQVGNLVDVEGAMNISDELDASEVSVFTGALEVDDADDAEIEGLVTTACGTTVPCSFKLDLLTVNVDANTEFEGGLLVTDIQPGMRIEVEGALVNGEVTAESIEFEDNIKLSAEVTSKTADSVTLEYGAVDITVMVENGITEFDGLTSLDDVNVGDHIDINGRMAGMDVIAIRIEDSAGSTDLKLQGIVSTVANPSLTVLGVTIDTSGLVYEDANNVVITQGDFFSMVNVNSVVEFEGTIVGTDLVWDSVEIE